MDLKAWWLRGGSRLRSFILGCVVDDSRPFLGYIGPMGRGTVLMANR